MFDLKQPCNECPFRPGQGERFQINKERLMEFFNAEAFPCHKTQPEFLPEGSKVKVQQCFGIMSILQAENKPNTIMQLASRLIGFDLDALTTAQSYKSIDETIKAHSRRSHDH